MTTNRKDPMPKIPPATVKVEAEIGPQLRLLLDGQAALDILRRALEARPSFYRPGDGVLHETWLPLNATDRALVERLIAEQG